MSAKTTLETLKAYLFITLGCLIYCLAWTQIFEPNGLVSGGISGLCLVIQYATGFPLAFSYGIFNAILLLAAFLILGRSFGIRTIYALITITLLFEFLPSLNLPQLGVGALSLNDKILLPVIASLIEAIGIAMMIKFNASSGGTDIIALIINKFWPVSLGKVYVMFDILIIASVMLVDGKTLDVMVYGYIAVIVFSTSLDFILLGSKSSVQIMVFSEKYTQIADYINKQMDRGVTALDAVGWYSGKAKKVLLIVVRRSEMSMLTDKIKEVDPKAFVTVAPVNSVFGEGFEEIKNGLKLKKRTNEVAKNDQQAS